MGVFPNIPDVIFTFTHEMAATDFPLIGAYSPPNILYNIYDPRP